MKNKIIIGIVCLVLGALVGYNLSSPSFRGISTSTTSVFSTAKIAEVGFIPTTASATTSAVLLNTDATDRIVTSAFAFCNGVGTSQTYLIGTGLAGLTFVMGTSSSVANSLPNVSSWALAISTSTSYAYTSTTTEPVSGPQGRIWASGTYWIINSNATNTASCVAGVHYLAS
jgi:hypothetical protein